MSAEHFTNPGYFPFPFPPYDIQEHFMKHLYGTIESGKVGIFESPTGTVRTNSMLKNSVLNMYCKYRF